MLTYPPPGRPGASIRPSRLLTLFYRASAAVVLFVVSVVALAILDNALTPEVSLVHAGRGPQALAIVRSLAADEARSVLLAGTSVGVSRSTDNGRTWLPSNSGLPQTDAQTVLVDPRDGSAYVTLFLVGVFRSGDGGQTWHNASAGLPGRAAFTIALDAQAGVFYLATFDYGMYRSRDGSTWETTGMGLTNMKIRALLPGLRPGELFAASDLGVYRSLDRASTWQNLTAGMPDVDAWSLALDPDTGVVYAGVKGGVLSFLPDGQGYRTGSIAWAGNPVRTVFFDPSARALYAATAGQPVVRSTDGGASWEPVGSGMGTSLVHTFLRRASASMLLAGTDHGVYRSSLDKQPVVWWHAERNPTSRHALSLLVDPIDGGVMAGTRGGGVFQLDDLATAWLPDSIGLGHTVVQALAIDHGGGALYAATPDGVFAAPLISTAWRRAGDELTGVNVLALAADRRGGVLYAVSIMGDTYRSGDGGGKWQVVSALQPVFARTVCFSAYYGIAYAGAYRGGVWQSRDHGFEWWPAGSGLSDQNIEVLLPDERTGALYAGTLGGVVQRLPEPDGVWETVGQRIPGPITAMALDEKTGTLIAATNAGLFRLPAEHSQWVPANVGLFGTRIVSLAAQGSSGRVYAGTMGDGVFLSVDGGLTWQPAGEGLDDAWVRGIAYDLTTGGLVSASDQRGAFVSTSGGATWRPANLGLPDLNVRGVVAGAADSSLVLVTSTDPYRSTDGASSWQVTLVRPSDVFELLVPLNAYGFAGRLPGGERVWASFGGGLLWARLASSLGIGAATITPDGQGRLQAVYGSQLTQTEPGTAYGRIPLVWMGVRVIVWNAQNGLARVFPAWWAVLLAVVALTALIWLLRRLELSRRFGVPAGVALFRPASCADYARPQLLDRAWPKWQDAIRQQLFVYGDVVASDLRSVPGPLRRYALERFAVEHGRHQQIGLARGRLTAEGGAGLFAWSAAWLKLRRGLHRQRFAWLHREKADQLASAFAATVGYQASPPHDFDSARVYELQGAESPLPRRLAFILVADADPGARTVKALVAALASLKLDDPIGVVVPLGAPGWRIDIAERLRAIVAQAGQSGRMAVLTGDDVWDVLAARAPAEALARILSRMASASEA